MRLNVACCSAVLFICMTGCPSTPPQVEPEPAAAPQDGTDGGACYGNSTCDDGLVCVDDVCGPAADGELDGACFNNGTCYEGLFCIDSLCVQYPCSGSEYLVDDECRALTLCSGNEYEAVAPTLESDRQCLPLTLCGDDEFETVAPTASSDRECQQLSSCSQNEFESVAPTSTTDRVCTLLTVCGDDEFESLAPTSTTDRVCALLTVCGDDEYESTPPTMVADRTCTPYTVCTDEQYIEVAPTSTTDLQCAARTVCGDDEVVSIPGSDTSDRACAKRQVLSGGFSTFCHAAPTLTRCWGRNAYGQASGAPYYSNTQVANGYDFSCALSSHGRITCWGNDDLGQSSPPAEPDFVRVAARDAVGCGLHNDGGVTCWGSNADGVLDIPPDLPIGRDVFVGLGGACVLGLDDTPHCWGSGTWVPHTPADQPFETLGLSDDEQCGLTSDGDITCWYADGGTATMQDGPYTQLTGGRHYNCALDTAGAPSCFGAQVPDVELKDVVSGGYFFCGLTKTDDYVCWNGNGQPDVVLQPIDGGALDVSLNSTQPWPIILTQSGEVQGTYADLTLDGIHSISGGTQGGIALAPDGAFEAWGLSIPGGTSFTQADVGVGVVCGITSAEKVECYGSSNGGVLNAPARAGYVSVGAGYQYACAVHEDGDLDCWGTFNGEPATSPSGTYLQVFAGFDEFCALTTNDLDCWSPRGTSSGGTYNASIAPGNAFRVRLNDLGALWIIQPPGVDEVLYGVPEFGAFHKATASKMSDGACLLDEVGAVWCFGTELTHALYYPAY